MKIPKRYYIYAIVIIALLGVLIYLRYGQPTFDDYKKSAESSELVQEIISSGEYGVNVTFVPEQDVMNLKAENHPFYTDIPIKDVYEFEYKGVDKAVLVIVDEDSVLLEAPITRLKIGS